MKKASKYRTQLHIDGIDLPVDISLERRKNTRFAITARRVTLRMPTNTTPELIQKHFADLKSWVSEQFRIRPTLRAQFAKKEYQTGDVLTVGARQYTIHIQFEDRATHSARLEGGVIQLILSVRATPMQRQRHVRTLLSRVVASDFYPEISRRVQELNDRTVKQPIKHIYLKYNSSNWGSCSAHGNVNLSTRLLFAPEAIQDYVILHELAHLVELNHSDRFWAIVERFMPDYQSREKWLKENRGSCDF